MVFGRVLRCHWESDTSVFPGERQRIQLAALLLLAAFTGSRPAALLSITYRDIELFLQKHPNTGKTQLMLHLKLTKTKSRKKSKRPLVGFNFELLGCGPLTHRRKTYTFCVDDNLTLCPISHLIVLALDDDAFGVKELKTPEQIFILRIRDGAQSLNLLWDEFKMNLPLFRPSVTTKEGIVTSSIEQLSYPMYHRWLKRLGQETGFTQVLKTYCLRRAVGNEINGN